jgi:hypothetical protein
VLNLYLYRKESVKGRLNLKKNGVLCEDRDLGAIKTKTIGLLCKIVDV